MAKTHENNNADADDDDGDDGDETCEGEPRGKSDDEQQDRDVSW